MNFEQGIEFAKKMDLEDPLAHMRQKFHIPPTKESEESIYLCGNSLGLQPKSVKESILQELEDWKNFGVEGHFHAKNPWLPYHEFLTPQLAKLVGAKPHEVVAMNNLTVNLHLMMVSFYRPTPKRHKILIEGGAFPSDLYAVTSQIRFHGFNPQTSLIELKPRPHELTLRMDDIENTLEEEGDGVALILLGGVNYFTGQFFDMEHITKKGRSKGCVVGFDLAHAVGNVPLNLNSWDVDFACWCSYKYLNSGPGSVAGCFVHERHADDKKLPRFCGWWGHDKKTRFETNSGFRPIFGAEGWQLSNPSILSLAAVKASLDIFHEIGMEALRKKSLLLTGYLEFLLHKISSETFTISPHNPVERGCQLSLVISKDGQNIFKRLTQRGIICDFREPNCIRAAPTPLYNSFLDVFNFAQILKESIQ